MIFLIKIKLKKNFLFFIFNQFKLPKTKLKSNTNKQINEEEIKKMKYINKLNQKKKHQFFIIILNKKKNQKFTNIKIKIKK